MFDFGSYDRGYHPQDSGVKAGLGWVENAQNVQETREVEGRGDVPGLRVGQVVRQSTFAMNAPELFPAANFTPNERQRHFRSICTQLLPIRGTGRGRSVMFDLYSMMALMQEISQSLRNVTRDLRKLENQVIFVNIKQQAAIQREAAVTGALVGGIMCGIQCAAMVGGIGKQLKSIKGQITACRLTGATADAKVATFNKVGANSTAGLKNLKTMQNKMPGINPEMSNYKAVFKEHPSGPVSEQRMGQLENKVNVAESKYSAAQKDLAQLKTSNAPQEKIDAAQARVNQAKKDLVGAKLERETAVKTNMEFNEGALKDVDHYRDQMKAAGGRYSEALEGFKSGKVSKAELKNAKLEFETAEKNYLMAGANQAAISSTLKLPNDAYKGMGASFDAQAAKSMGEAQCHPMYKKSELSNIHGSCLSQLGMQIGMYLQQLTQSIKEIMASRGVELQAQQKVTEEQFDQLRDIFGQLQSAIQKVLDIFSAITQKESQTVEDIMNNFKA